MSSAKVDRASCAGSVSPSSDADPDGAGSGSGTSASSGPGWTTLAPSDLPSLAEQPARASVATSAAAARPVILRLLVPMSAPIDGRGVLGPTVGAGLLGCGRSCLPVTGLMRHRVPTGLRVAGP